MNRRQPGFTGALPSVCPMVQKAFDSRKRSSRMVLYNNQRRNLLWHKYFSNSSKMEKAFPIPVPDSFKHLDSPHSQGRSVRCGCRKRQHFFRLWYELFGCSWQRLENWKKRAAADSGRICEVDLRFTSCAVFRKFTFNLPYFNISIWILLLHMDINIRCGFVFTSLRANPHRAPAKTGPDCVYTVYCCVAHNRRN